MADIQETHVVEYIKEFYDILETDKEFKYYEKMILHLNYINIAKMLQIIEHDGYDRYGPKSDLYDLYVFYQYNHKYYIEQWHREDWVYQGSDEFFELCNTYEVSTKYEWTQLMCNELYDLKNNLYYNIGSNKSYNIKLVKSIHD